MRRPVLAANWKMNILPSEVKVYGDRLLEELKGMDIKADVAVIPPFTAIYPASLVFSGTCVYTGAQNVYPKDRGAYTGEVSAPMLLDMGVRYVVCGHSERRQYFNETDGYINSKVLAVLNAGLVPILCVGETKDERDKGTGRDIVLDQVRKGLLNVSPDAASDIVIAYEPVWAIGTGCSATCADAQSMISDIREVLCELYGPEISELIRIQYGGSVKPENIADFMKCPDIDGALIGGAGLDPVSFAKIIKNIPYMDK